MKKGILKVLFLVGVLAFTLPMVGCHDNVSPNQENVPVNEDTINDDFLSAIKEGNLEEVKGLIEKGADVNFVSLYEDTPLIVASREGNLEIAKLLVEKGADANFSTFHENTALSNACASGNLELVKYIIDSGADVDHIGLSGRTQLGFACANGNMELAKLLIENGADVNACTETGEEPLKLACEYGNLEIAKFLVENRADVNIISAEERAKLGIQNNKQQESVENSSKTAYTNEQLIEMTKKYRTDKGEYIPEFVEVDGEKGDIVNIHLYDVKEENISTSDWYFINKYTGKGTNILNEEVDLT